MKFNVKASLVAGAMALTGLASSANAAVISYTEAFSFGSTSLTDTTNDGSAVTDTASQSFDVAGFDSSLGTLTDVFIFFDTDWSLQAMVESFDDDDYFVNKAKAKGAASTEMTVTLTNPVGASEDKIRSRVASCSDTSLFWSDAECTETDNASGNFNDVLDLSSISLTSFIGGMLEFEVTRSLTAALTKCGHDDVCSLTNTNNEWGGELVVAYQYDEASTGPSASVPEPAILAVFGLGLLGFSAARRGKA